MGINQVRNLETIATQKSIIHNLEGRIKLISILFLIVYTVFSTQLIVPVILEIFLLVLMYLSHLSFKDSFKRVALLLPFGGFIIIFQPFIHPGNIIWTSSISWIHITDAGLMWGILLLSRLIVCLTAIVLLSSTSPMQEVVQSFRKLGMPKDLAMIFSIMIRFLFMFVDELEIIRKAQSSRNFDAFNSKLSYKWRIKQVGYTVAMMFLKAYEKGETVYLSMVSRCFSEKSELYSGKKSITSSDYKYIAMIIGLIVVVQIIALFFPHQLGFLGLHLI